MSKHIWKENSIDTGLFDGMMTSLQGWKCKTCQSVIFLPHGTSPNDYVQTACKGGSDNVYRTNPSSVHEMQKSDRLQTPNVNNCNRRELRVMRAKERVQTSEKN